MANTAYQTGLTKPHMGGATSTLDQHLEVYTGEVDTKFKHTSLFESITPRKSVAQRSNNIRIDRLGGSKVMGRTSGVALESQAVRSDKLVITVDTVIYIRNPIDYQDDWTAPDFLREMAQNNGTEFARLYDTANLLQLIRCNTFVAPAHLADSFGNGKKISVERIAAPKNRTEQEANAIASYFAFRKGVDMLVKERQPLGDLKLVVDTDIFSDLQEHPKALNKDFSTRSPDYSDRRVADVAGVTVIESTEFPQVVGALPLHSAGNNFTVTADDLKFKAVLFNSQLATVIVEAQPFTSRMYDDPKEFANVLDCYAMYTIGQRRPDTVVAFEFVAPTP